MSRRGKKLKQIDEQIIVEPKFYVHYLQDGTIISSNNHRDEKYELAVEITYDQHHRLVTGLDKFLDFRVSTVIDENGNPVPGLVPIRVIEEHNFKNRLLKWIDNKDTDNAEIEIHRDEYNKQWLFLASDDFRKKYYENKLPIADLLIFVTLGNDPDFLIRTFKMELKKIVLDKLIFPYETKWEENINEIALTTNLASIKYALKVWRTREQY